MPSSWPRVFIVTRGELVVKLTIFLGFYYFFSHSFCQSTAAMAFQFKKNDRAAIGFHFHLYLGRRGKKYASYTSCSGGLVFPLTVSMSIRMVLQWSLALRVNNNDNTALGDRPVRHAVPKCRCCRTGGAINSYIITVVDRPSDCVRPNGMIIITIQTTIIIIIVNAVTGTSPFRLPRQWKRRDGES